MAFTFKSIVPLGVKKIMNYSRHFIKLYTLCKLKKNCLYWFSTNVVLYEISSLIYCSII